MRRCKYTRGKGISRTSFSAGLLFRHIFMFSLSKHLRMCECFVVRSVSISAMTRAFFMYQAIKSRQASQQRSHQVSDIIIVTHIEMIIWNMIALILNTLSILYRIEREWLRAIESGKGKISVFVKSVQQPHEQKKNHCQINFSLFSIHSLIIDAHTVKIKRDVSQFRRMIATLITIEYALSSSAIMYLAIQSVIRAV